MAWRHDLIGFLDDVNPERAGIRFCGLPVLGRRERLGDLRREGVTHVIFGFGNYAARLRLADFVRSLGFSLAVAIHPRSVIAEDVSLGGGTLWRPRPW